MKVRVESRDLERQRCDFLAVLITKVDREKRKLPNRLHGVDRLLGGRLSQLIESGDFRGNGGEILLLFPGEECNTRRVLLIGVFGGSALLLGGLLAASTPEALTRAATSALIYAMLGLLLYRGCKSPGSSTRSTP